MGTLRYFVFIRKLICAELNHKRNPLLLASPSQSLNSHTNNLNSPRKRIKINTILIEIIQ